MKRDKRSVVNVVAIGSIVLFIVVFIIISVVNGSIDNTTVDDVSQQATEESQPAKDNSAVLTEVKSTLDSMDTELKSMLASTSQNGYQGEIIDVEAYGEDGVKVKVSTFYDKTGYEDEGGQNIARKIMSNLCLSVRGLNSLYVSSTNSGLDSRSVYRADLPVCKV